MQQNDTTLGSTIPTESAEPAPVADAAPVRAEPAKAPAAPDDSPEASEAALRAELSAAYRKATAQPERGNDGKFAPKAGESAPAPEAAKPVAAPADTEKTSAVPPAAVEPPRAWTADMKAHWDKLDPALRTHLSAREAELQQAKTDNGRLASEYGPLREVLQHHKDYFAQVGRPIPQLINEWAAASYALDTNPAHAIKQLANIYGVNLGDIWDPAEQAPDPKVAALARENQRLKEIAESTHRDRAVAEAAAREQAMLSVVQEFAKANPDVMHLDNEFLPAIQAVQALNPKATPQDVLKQAYEQAVWANPKTREQRIAAMVTAQEKARAAAAEKAAEAAQKVRSVNVNGAVRGSDADSIDASLRAIWRKHASR